MKSRYTYMSFFNSSPTGKYYLASFCFSPTIWVIPHCFKSRKIAAKTELTCCNCQNIQWTEHSRTEGDLLVFLFWPSFCGLALTQWYRDRIHDSSHAGKLFRLWCSRTSFRSTIVTGILPPTCLTPCTLPWNAVMDFLQSPLLINHSIEHCSRAPEDHHVLFGQH